MICDWGRPTIIAALCAVCVLCASVSCQTANDAVVSRIIDGDTFQITEGETVRIIGIDALEGDELSAAYLEKLIEGKAVRLVFGKDKRDRYGRLLAYVELSDGTDIGARMIQEGQALAYLKYPFERQDRYIPLEIEARKASKGIWAGHFRASRAPPASDKTVIDTVASDDPIVYVTRTGKKYHRDGCRYLRKSKISMKLSEAQKRFGPCSVCWPPR